MTLVPIKQSPSSSRWNFRGERNGYQFWSVYSGKTYAKRLSDGQWFKVVPKTNP